jgi:hypothetical protein
MRNNPQKKETMAENAREQSQRIEPELPPCPYCSTNTTHPFHTNTTLTTTGCMYAAMGGGFENTCLNMLTFLFFA